MPKKYRQKALLTKPTSSVPSSLRATTAANNEAPSEPSVNDLIREFRKASHNDQPTDAAALPSMHPSLRAVLNIPTALPPAPRRQLRGPVALRRIPGPPPPRSWLIDSQHAPAGNSTGETWQKARLHHTVPLPGGQLPRRDSLQHYAMMAMAKRWAWHVEYDHEWLSAMPTALKQSLLSYLAAYDESHWPDPIRYLFPVDSDQEELSQVSRLDLANGIGSWATTKKLESHLQPRQRHDERQDAHDLPDSWEDDTDSAPALTVTRLNSKIRFSNLKHLSLAVDPSSRSAAASWSALITLASSISTITSLSLAHWPPPTYTPNASSSRAKISMNGGPSVIYAASNPYTAFDDDWQEAASILRSLSRLLYCLTWLDLSGCGDWFRALTWSGRQFEDSNRVLGPDWNGSWRNVDTLSLNVGWTPIRPEMRDGSEIDDDLPTHDLPGLRYDERTQQSLDQLSQRRLAQASTTSPRRWGWNIEHEREKYYFKKDLERYNQIQASARTVAAEIRSVRAQAKGKWIEFSLSEELSLDSVPFTTSKLPETDRSSEG